MLDIKSVNHIGIRVKDKSVSVAFYENFGFQLTQDVGFDKGHPVVMKHPSGVILNLLGPATISDRSNILMDVTEKYPGYTHIALTVSSLDDAKDFMKLNDIDVTGSFSFQNMSAIFIRDPDRNVIELDAYNEADTKGSSGYVNHP